MVSTFHITSPNFNVMNVIVNLLLAKNQPENILIRLILVMFSRFNIVAIVVRMKSGVDDIAYFTNPEGLVVSFVSPKACYSTSNED